MASTLATPITPDTVLSFQLRPGTLARFLESRAEGGPRLKCLEGSVTLVSPGRSHEGKGHRLDHMILAICLELGIRYTSLGSTTWTLPPGAGDTAYEADEAYHVQSHGTSTEDQPPDLAIEVVVTHPETKALKAGAALKIPELWVLDLPKHRLTIYILSSQSEGKSTYGQATRSRAFPFLSAADVLERLDDDEPYDAVFHQGCRAWARRVLVPRREREEADR